MRLKLLRRRLTISSPRMAVRSAMPWPLRWVLISLVFGFCAAIALWAFEFGKEIAGIDGVDQEQIARLQAELEKARSDRDQAQSIANTAQTMLTAEKAVQDQLAAQKKVLQAEVQSLRDDLGFYEKLVTGGASDGLGIRALQAEVQEDSRLRWRVLISRPGKNAGEFQGSLDVVVAGTLNGKPWTSPAQGGTVPVRFGQFGRFQGLVELPAQVGVKTVTVRVMEGTAVRATQVYRL